MINAHVVMIVQAEMVGGRGYPAPTRPPMMVESGLDQKFMRSELWPLAHILDYPYIILP